MKAISIITTIIISAVTFFSCSDNAVQNISEEPVISALNSKPQSQNKILIWSHDGIMVRSQGGPGASNEIISNITEDYISNVLITFEGWTDSDTSSYISQIILSMVNSGDAIFAEETGVRINRYHELHINLEGSNQVKFYIALVDAELERIPSNASLKISKIRIYDLN